MKENKLIEMKNKVETLGSLTQHLLMEMDNLKTLSVGTLETLKRMDGYETAIEKMKEQALEHAKLKEESNNVE